MPELPEVETIKRRLATVLPGKKILDVEVFHAKPFQGLTEAIIGSKIIAVKRRAKILQFDLDNGLFVLSHLKMTGQWIYVDEKRRLGGGHPSADWVQELPSKHTRIMFTLSDDARLFFNDQRIFGWVKVVDQNGLEKEYSQLGPDVVNDTFTLPYFAKRLQTRGIPIKQAIMDNLIVCGIGNIYACDALNLARINPLRPAKSLKPHEVETLYSAAKSVINLGIELGGATIEHFTDIDGFGGKYQEQVLAYGREGQPCKNCNTPIVKIKLGGRGTYFCPNCQI